MSSYSGQSFDNVLHARASGPCIFFLPGSEENNIIVDAYRKIWY